MVEKLDLRAGNFNRDRWSVPQRFETRKLAEPRQQRLDDKHLVLNPKSDPSVSRAIPPGGPGNEASVVAETQKLPARPEGEVVTISAAALFELLGRHPMVPDAELFLIRHVPAGFQKRANILDVPADDFQRLAEEGAHRSAHKRRVPLAWLRDALAVEIIEPGNGFRNHSSRSIIPTVRIGDDVLTSSREMGGTVAMKASILLVLFCAAAWGAGLELLVLGSGGPRPFGRAASSYLVLVDGTPRILVDAGPGAFLRIGELKADLDRVDTVLLTHLHIDHTGDIAGVLLARGLTARANSIHFTVFGPDGAGAFPSTSNFVNLLFGEKGAWAYQSTFGSTEDIKATNLPIALDSGEQVVMNKDGLEIRSIATHHDDCPSVGYRVNYKGESIVFSGDMDASALANITRLAKGCNLFVFNCVVLDPPGSPQQLYALHTPPKKIGEAAAAAGAKRLLLSHLAPAIEEASKQVLASIHASYKGPVEFASDKMRVAVH